MTLKELLCTISFEEIEPHIALLYPDMATPQMLELFRFHHKLLCRLIPQVDESEQPCIIAMTKWKEDESPLLDAYNIEGCEWEVALSKEIVVEPEVTASLSEIAACCLWHTSFYGFTPQQREEVFLEFDQKATRRSSRNKTFYKELIEETKKKYPITWERFSNEWGNLSEEEERQ
ncbi:hypothetical protein HQ36_05980 [Porphyromonas gingivicanis]|uniref:Uncharacterized protein n=1 Tax=Porphyromonas gingivicanis TaxID=266762 RepID=A0A0A2GAH1_9PORP|nr:DUF6557 family protein [Porphyromonas gingivicanis]KGN97449.1 hypothetical protein HQ36_05980 [Porphyromonas gingivicanis]